MRPLIADLGLSLWRLLPANPIVVRVVQIGSKRLQHFWARTGYLVILLFVVLASQLYMTGESGDSLGEKAKSSTAVFEWISILQLGMMCFLAPVFTAGAISQEKDSETFNVLLTTPLTNAQIVLGSLMSRLFFVITLLLSGLPVFCVTMLYGGVTTQMIFLSFGIAACTAILTGSVAILISVMKIGTRGTIFSFYAGIAVFLFAGFAIGFWDKTFVPESIAPGSLEGMSWLAPFHPFLALFVALKWTPAPEAASVAHYGWPIRDMLTAPHSAYMFLTLLLSVLLVAMATFFVRQGVKQGELTLWRRFLRRIMPRRIRTNASGELSRRPRRVWANPVAWREAAAKGGAANSQLVRYGYLLVGVATAIGLLIAHNSGAFVGTGPGIRSAAAEARAWLSGIVMVEFVTVMFMAVNTAATAITRERETGTMELLLSTPLTSRYIIWGKLRGLVSFTIPLMAVPAGTVLLMAINDWISGATEPVVSMTSALVLPPLLLVYSALVCMLSLQMSLKSKGSVPAVLASMAILVIAGFGLGLCAIGFVETAGAFAGVMTPLTFVTALWMVLNPADSGLTSSTEQVYFVFGTLIAVALYGGIVAGIYKTMVRDFDMIVRKQSR